MPAPGPQAGSRPRMQHPESTPHPPAPRPPLQEPIPVEQLVRNVCDTKQGYTQFGGQRPFGVSILYAGW
jgi:hypothetical protein